MLAKTFDISKDYSNWYLSEKLDGYRCFWNTKNFISRNGNIFNVPNEIKNKMPNIFLDGEIYINRKNFSDLSILKTKKQMDIETFDSKKIKYHLFDLPKLNIRYEDKIKTMKKISSNYGSFIKFVRQIKVKNNDEIMYYFNKYLGKEAEGIMLRHPNSYYENGRSNNLIKLKPRYDTEAIITGFNLDSNRMLKSFQCKYKDKSFKISGFSNEIKKNFRKTHKINDVITFEYDGFTDNGIPRHATYKRLYKK